MAINIARRERLKTFRQDPFVCTFRVRGFNLSGAILRFMVRLYPNAPGVPLIALSNTITRGAKGIRVVDAGTTDGVDWTDIEIIAPKSEIASLPTASDIDADAVFAYDFEWDRLDAGAGFSQLEETILFGEFVVQGSVNNG